jgi:Acetyltransferase (GNAT) family.
MVTFLQEIKQLQQICENKDQIRLKLNEELLQTRNRDDRYQLLRYEDGVLIAFLGIYPFGNKVELTGMVHPDHRRKGLFTRLFNEAILRVRQEGKENILLNTPKNSLSGQAFLKSVPCKLETTEYQMKWERMDLLRSEDVKVRPSRGEDFPLEVELDRRCFGFSKQEAIQYNQEIRKDPASQCLIIEFEGKPVGKIRTEEQENGTWIYGFAILPEYQNRGIGRKALHLVTRMESERGKDVYLEVEAKNERAIALYKSSGYRVIQAQDYFRYTG